ASSAEIDTPDVIGTYPPSSLGPVGFEPTTKGFTLPRRFRREWTISSPVNGMCRLISATHSVRVGAGCSCLSLRALEPSGSLCTFRRCTAGSAQDCHELQRNPQLEGSPEFIPST